MITITAQPDKDLNSKIGNIKEIQIQMIECVETNTPFILDLNHLKYGYGDLFERWLALHERQFTKGIAHMAPTLWMEDAMNPWSERPPQDGNTWFRRDSDKLRPLMTLHNISDKDRERIERSFIWSKERMADYKEKIEQQARILHEIKEIVGKNAPRALEIIQELISNQNLNSTHKFMGRIRKKYGIPCPKEIEKAKRKAEKENAKKPASKKRKVVMATTI